MRGCLARMGITPCALGRVALAIALLPPAGFVRAAQPQASIAAPALAVRIGATVDSAEAGRIYLPARREVLASRLVEHLTSYLQDRLERVNNRSVAVLAPGQEAAPNVRHLSIDCTLRLDATFRVFVRCSGREAANTVVTWGPRSTPLGRLKVDTGDLRRPEGDLQQELAVREIAGWASSAVQDDMYAWLTESTVRLRVVVDTFVPLVDSANQRLGRLLREWVEGELVQSAAVFVVTQRDTGRVNYNYRITGGYSQLGGKLRIDIRCVKRGPEERLLASRYVVVEVIDALHLSRAVRSMIHELRHAMEADFSRSLQTLAVVATMGSERFGFRRASGRDMAIAGELMRRMALKVQRLASPPAGDTVLRLQVVSDPAAVERYDTARVAPSEILADLRAEYLLLLNYQNLGQKVRLTAELHSYDVERPAAGVLLRDREMDVSELGLELDAILAELVRQMRLRGLATNAPDTTVAQLIGGVPLRSLERTRRLWLRTGAPVHRNSPALFLGRRSGFYLEAGYARRVVRSGRSGGRFDGGLELLVGVETTSLVGGQFSFDGPAALTAVLNGTVTLTPWQYSATSFNVTLGAGLGMQGLRYNLHPGDLDYTGTTLYRESAFSAVWSTFGHFYFPMPFVRGMDMDLVARWVQGTTRITQFRSLPLERFDSMPGPTGKLGGLYVVWGIAYVF